MKFPAVLVILPFLFGCSKFLEKFSRSDSSTTQVSFTTQNAGLLTATLPGGILVYAEREQDFLKASLKLDDENDSSILNLPNGTYEFLAVGWPSPGLTGNPKCGFHIQPGGPVALTGAPVTVTIDLTNANCDDDYFAPSPTYRTGSTFNFFEFKFCNAFVDISGFTGTNICDQTRESVRFIKGRTGTGVGAAGEGFPDPTVLRMVYQADPHVPNRKEVFSVDFDGVGTVKESGTSTQGSFSVDTIQSVPGEGKVIFSANKDSTSRELFISDVGVGNPTKISGALASPGAAYGIKSFRVNSTGTHVVFVGDMDTTGIFEVYSVHLDSGVRTKLNPTVSSGTGVKDNSGYWLMDVSPDGNSVAWVATSTSASVKAMYSASVSGGAGSGVKLSGTVPQVNFEVMDFSFTHDSAKVVWSGDYTTDNISEIYVANTNDDDSSQIINEAPGTFGVKGKILVAKDSLDIIYIADRNGFNNQFSVYSADLGVASPFARTRIHTITSTNSNIHNLKFNDTETKVAYFSDAAVPGTYKIYSATLGSTDSHVDRSHTSAASMPFEIGGGGGGDGPIQITTDDRVFYRGSLTGGVADLGIYEFSLGDSALATLKSQAHSTSREVPSFTLGYGKLFFPFDLTTDNIHQLFYFTPGSAPISELSVLGGNLGSVKGVFIPKGSDTLPGYPNAMAIAGFASGTTLEDLFFLPDYNNPSDLRQISHSYHQTSGIGKFQIHMLEYRTDPAGNIFYSTPAISSACLDGPTVDGSGRSLSVEAIRFPTGDGLDDSPFAAAIDIFPEAEDCSGSPQRLVFRNGIAAPATSNAPNKLRLTNSGSTPVLFIKD
jgi:hypothetical protein